jgi:hypothetical protein
MTTTVFSVAVLLLDLIQCLSKHERVTMALIMNPEQNSPLNPQPQPLPGPAPVKRSLVRLVLYGLIGFVIGAIIGVILGANIGGAAGRTVHFAFMIVFTASGIVLARKRDSIESSNDAKLAAIAASQPAITNVAVYRQYPIFTIILLLLPAVIGLAILFTGGVYKKINQNFVAISGNEKIALSILSILAQVYVLYSLLK